MEYVFLKYDEQMCIDFDKTFRNKTAMSSIDGGINDGNYSYDDKIEMVSFLKN